MKNIIDDILLSLTAVQRWMDLSKKTVRHWARDGIRPPQISTEQAVEVSGGRLTIFVEATHHGKQYRCEMLVEPHEWAWQKPLHPEPSSN